MTPFICESTVEGKRCQNFGSHLYKSASTTRLVCDECVIRYRKGGPGGGVPNLMEVAVMELIPARENLNMKLGRLERLNEKMRRLAAVGAEERAMLDRMGGILLTVFAVLFFGAAWLPSWVMIPLFAAYAATMVWLHWWSSKRWLPRKVDEINKTYGYPERENY